MLDRRGRQPNDPTRLRINEAITAPTVLLIRSDGTNEGEVPTEVALRIAREENLDLVEVAPHSSPPVCRILDYGKHRYEQQKRDHQARKRAASQELKEIRLRPRIGQHDLEIKLGKARDFLEEGHRVLFNMLFRGREATFADMGLDVMERVVAALEDVARVERGPVREGRRLQLLMLPKSRKGAKGRA